MTTDCIRYEMMNAQACFHEATSDDARRMSHVSASAPPHPTSGARGGCRCFKHLDPHTSQQAALIKYYYCLVVGIFRRFPSIPRTFPTLGGFRGSFTPFRFFHASLHFFVQFPLCT